MLNTILMVVIVLLMVVIVYLITRERKRAALDIQELIASEIHELFDQDIILNIFDNLIHVTVSWCCFHGSFQNVTGICSVS